MHGQPQDLPLRRAFLGLDGASGRAAGRMPAPVRARTPSHTELPAIKFQSKLLRHLRGHS